MLLSCLWFVELKAGEKAKADVNSQVMCQELAMLDFVVGARK